MALKNDDGQWIVLMGLLVAVGLFFLALIINQSALVGQTTAEGVLEFPKNDIRDLKSEMYDVKDIWSNSASAEMRKDLYELALHRRNAVADVTIGAPELISGVSYRKIEIHYNNGVTAFNETAYW